MSAQLGWAIVAGVGLGLGLWLIASLAPRLSRPRLARRVAPYLQDVSAGAREALAPAASGPLPVLSVLVHPATEALGRMFDALLGGSAPLARRLRQSASSLTVDSFRASQLVWGLSGVGVGMVAALAAPGALSVALVALAGVGGVAARELVLRHAVARRLERLNRELPLVLEFLTLSLSAGEGILDALRRVAHVSAGELSGEIARVVASVSTGLPLAQTLTTLARELELPAFTRFVEQVVGALERGTPLAEVLRAQAQDARRDAKRHLLEVAGRKEVAMLIPLVFLILPVTILFAVFPGIFVLELGR